MLWKIRVQPFGAAKHRWLTYLFRHRTLHSFLSFRVLGMHKLKFPSSRPSLSGTCQAASVMARPWMDGRAPETRPLVEEATIISFYVQHSATAEREKVMLAFLVASRVLCLDCSIGQRSPHRGNVARNMREFLGALSNIHQSVGMRRRGPSASSFETGRVLPRGGDCVRTCLPACFSLGVVVSATTAPVYYSQALTG